MASTSALTPELICTTFPPAKSTEPIAARNPPSPHVSIKGLLLESGVGLTEQEKSVVEEILSKSKSSYQQITMSKKMLEDDIFKNIDAFPTTFFIDKDGNIVDQIDGSNDYEGWKSRIEDVLKKVDANE